MEIIQINRYHYISGGAARYYLEISKLLKTRGHKIAFFSTLNNKNISTPYKKYFTSGISFEKNNYSNALKAVERIVYSRESKAKLAKLLKDFPTDIIHLHTIYHYLSPSIIHLAKQRNIPVVQTLGDYHIISPNCYLFHENKICEISKKNKFYKAILHKCVKNSYFITFLEVMEKYISEILGWEKNYIDYFITPSLFMKRKLIEYGMSVKKIIHLPYFIDLNNYKPNFESGNYILYFGRLSSEKGLNILLKAMKFLPKIRLIIAGKGDIFHESELNVQTSKLNNIKFVGFQDGRRLKTLITFSRFIVLPSLWYDVAPLSILESFGSGKPVIASDIGGIPETVKDSHNGLLTKPGNVVDLSEKINKLWNNFSLCRNMGINAREYVEKYFGPKEHYEKLMEIYKRAITRHS